MHKIIDRNLTLEFELDQLAKDFGYNLEVDEYDDIHHSGYTSQDIKNMGHLSLPEKFEDVDSYVICLLKGDSFLMKTNRHRSVEEFSQKIMEEL